MDIEEIEMIDETSIYLLWLKLVVSGKINWKDTRDKFNKPFKKETEALLYGVPGKEKNSAKGLIEKAVSQAIINVLYHNSDFDKSTIKKIFNGEKILWPPPQPSKIEISLTCNIIKRVVFLYNIPTLTKTPS